MPPCTPAITTPPFPHNTQNFCGILHYHQQLGALLGKSQPSQWNKFEMSKHLETGLVSLYLLQHLFKRYSLIFLFAKISFFQ